MRPGSISAQMNEYAVRTDWDVDRALCDAGGEWRERQTGRAVARAHMSGECNTLSPEELDDHHRLWGWSRHTCNGYLQALETEAQGDYRGAAGRPR